VGGRFPNLWTRISSIYTALGTGRMQSGCTDESNWPAPKLSLPTKRGEIYGSRIGFKLKSKTESICPTLGSCLRTLKGAKISFRIGAQNPRPFESKTCQNRAKIG